MLFDSPHRLSLQMNEAEYNLNVPHFLELCEQRNM